MSDERIIRLVGDGENEMSGGGLMLPDAFAAPLQYLLDIPGQAPWELLIKKIMDVMSKKENRILAIWGSWDSFGEDVLLQLGVKGLIKVESLYPEGKKFFCSLPGDFIPGHEYEVISIAEITSARHGKHSPDRAETVIAYDGKTREEPTAGDATYVAQLKELGDVLLRGKPQLITNADSLGNMAAIDAIYAKAGVARDFG